MVDARDFHSDIYATCSGCRVPGGISGFGGTVLKSGG
jgi:hypothetical protein